VALCASAFYVRYAAGLPIEGSVVVTAGPFEVRIDGTPPPATDSGFPSF
jgi:hypothetical protein